MRQIRIAIATAFLWSMAIAAGIAQPTPPGMVPYTGVPPNQAVSPTNPLPTYLSAGPGGSSTIINQVSGQDTQVSITPTVTASAYAVNNCVGGFNAISIARINGGNGLLQNVILMSKTGLTPSLTVYLFNANPTASTCTDKSTFTLNVADLPKLIAAPFVLSLVAPQGSTPSMAELASMARPFVVAGGTQTIYVALVAGSIFTPASTTEFIFNAGADLN